MIDNPFAGRGNLKLEIQRIDAVWYAHLPQTALWGSGETIVQAVERLHERHGAYERFLSETGSAPLNLFDAQPAPRTILRQIGRIARMVAVAALVAVPISYGLSTGISRGFGDLTRGFKLSGVIATLERGIIDLSRPENDLSPERAQALSAAITRIVDRLRPFTAPAGTLFETPSEKSTPPEKSTPSEKSPAAVSDEPN